MSASRPAAHKRYRASRSAAAVSGARAGRRAHSAVPRRAQLNRTGAIHSTSRLARGDTRDREPKYTALSGAVSAITPRLADRVPAAKRQSLRPARPGRRAVSAAWRRGVTSSSPATEAKDSCRLTDATAKGLCSRIASRAADRDVGPSPSRPARGASSMHPAITQERTTEGVAPTISAYRMSTGYPRRAVSRCRRPVRAPSRSRRKPQWRPETAVMCMSPASLRSRQLCSSRPSRSPVSRARMRPLALPL